MNDKAFIDTNVLVYAYDSGDPARQAIARSILRRSLLEDSAALSSQVFSEFFVVVTRRITPPMTGPEAWKILRTLSTLQVAEIDLDLVNRAIETHIRHRISYWDALIVAAAERTGCSRILSEDLGHNQRYNDVLIENPFRTTE